MPIILIPKAAIAAAVVRLVLLVDRPPAFTVLTVFATLSQLQTIGRADIYHQGQAATAGFLLLGLWVMNRGTQTGADTRAPAHLQRDSLAFATIAVVCGFAFMTGALGISRVERGPLQERDANLIAGVRTLVANTTRADPVYVGLTNHRFTFINSMLAYYLADRRSGVRVAMFNPGITNTDGVQHEMIDELVQSRTRFLLLDDHFASVFEESNASRMPGSTVLDTFIQSHFVEACEFGDTRILVGRDVASGVVCVQPTQETLLDILAGLGPSA